MYLESNNEEEVKDALMPEGWSITMLGYSQIEKCITSSRNSKMATSKWLTLNRNMRVKTSYRRVPGLSLSKAQSDNLCADWESLGPRKEDPFPSSMQMGHSYSEKNRLWIVFHVTGTSQVLLFTIVSSGHWFITLVMLSSFRFLDSIGFGVCVLWGKIITVTVRILDLLTVGTANIL